MTQAKPEFSPLPNPQTAASEARRIGIEFEFAGLDLQQAVDTVRSTLSGEVKSQNPAEQFVDVPDLGEFRIEVDWSLLKQLAADKSLPQPALQALSDSATLLVPIEIVCPPLPPSDFDSLHRLTVELREAGAKGTEQSPLFAFGLHINIELPDCEAATIDSYMKAYALLQAWLLEENGADLSRRLTPYVDLYPDAYLLAVLRRESPSLDTLFDDYLQYNPTRNRALDLLPLLSVLDEERVRDRVDDARIKARPAFHYRLPDCRIDNADWSLAEPWNLWCAVERLVADGSLLKEITRRALEDKNGKPRLLAEDWVESVSQWLPAEG